MHHAMHHAMRHAMRHTVHHATHHATHLWVRQVLCAPMLWAELMGGARRDRFWQLVASRIEIYLAQLATSPGAGTPRLLSSAMLTLTVAMLTVTMLTLTGAMLTLTVAMLALTGAMLTGAMAMLTLTVAMLALTVAMLTGAMAILTLTVAMRTTGAAQLLLRAMGESSRRQLGAQLAARLEAELPAAAPLLYELTDASLQLESLMRDKMRTLTSAEFERVLHPVFEEDELTLILIGTGLGGVAGFAQAAAGI